MGGIGRKRPSISRGFCGVHQSVTPKATPFNHHQNLNGTNVGDFSSSDSSSKQSATGCDELPGEGRESTAFHLNGLDKSISDNPALMRIVKKWPNLQPHIREAILTLVDAGGEG